MEKVLSVSLGEIALKRGNRKFFEDKLIKQMIKAIKDLGLANAVILPYVVEYYGKSVYKPLAELAELAELVGLVEYKKVISL